MTGRRRGGLLAYPAATSCATDVPTSAVPAWPPMSRVFGRDQIAAAV